MSIHNLFFKGTQWLNIEHNLKPIERIKICDPDHAIVGTEIP